jgi:glycosyltransferase involved in cell wall biosynthesis
MSKRIVLFTLGLTEPGGVQTRGRLTATELASRGWRVYVIARAGSMHRFRFTRDGRRTVLEVPGFDRRRLGALLFLACAIPTGLVWGRRPVAFLSFQLMSTSTAAAVCALLSRRPFLAMSTLQHSEVAYLRSTRLWRLRRWLLGHAALVLAQTREAGGTLLSIVPDDRIAVLPNPVAVPASPPALTGAPRVAFAGRLSTEKDLPTLLEAWRAVIEDRSDATLILAGVGGSHRSAEEEVRQTIEDDPLLRPRVELPGWVNDLPALLDSADVFVLPSIEEGMSNALLEACARGRIVIASNIAPNRAVLGSDYPLLFPPGDATELTVALERALAADEPFRHEVRERLRTRMRGFSTDAVIERLEALIDAASGPHH